MAAIFMFLFC